MSTACPRRRSPGEGSVEAGTLIPRCRRTALVRPAARRSRSDTNAYAPRALHERIGGDRDQKDGAVQQLARRIRDVEQRCDVVDQGQENGSQQRADERPPSARQSGPTQEDRSETLQAIGGA